MKQRVMETWVNMELHVKTVPSPIKQVSGVMTLAILSGFEAMSYLDSFYYLRNEESI